ncbi:molybdate ABC transporter permease subunit [Aliidiomarina haloalkalitolerans]|uniref:Molybdenum transport system permease n=1 Tax=Aliidiomarina haloalkalitolerans TaxID=859059 RepID=A0A432VW20_9GAMM|nr:molybdate ABC transporter permease subunit [Aliidiomarina haloalkalitolerans]RUO20745.1 molybdate ABC transporter permease subunit [Aliidiomarina haloalkalitolerans]
MSANDLQAIWLTLQLAAVSTVILLILSLPLAWWLSQTTSRWRALVEATVALPLVLPPTVLGFYLLVALGPEGFIGGSLEALGMQHLAFSFTGLVIGSVVYSLPFAVQPLQNAFASVPRELLEAAACLRARFFDRFRHLVLPLAKRGFITAAVLSFAHTIGEFGVVLMIGGNIPGETQVVSIAIYDHVEGLNYGAANQLSLWLLAFSLVVLLIVYSLNRGQAVMKLRGA